jgi:hypothetical protein
MNAVAGVLALLEDEPIEREEHPGPRSRGV